MRAGIYAIRNFQTDKIYIGQAVNIYKRWKNHRIELRLNRHGNRYLQSAYNKYGSVNLVFYVMEYCNTASLDDREQFYMDLYNSYDREDGYNLSPTAGGSCTGFKHSEETKAEWSKNRIGKKRSEEGRLALKAGAAKRKLTYIVSDETRKLLSEIHKAKNRKHTDKFKSAMSERLMGNSYNLGRKHGKRSPEVIARVVEAKRKAARLRFKALMFID